MKQLFQVIQVMSGGFTAYLLYKSLGYEIAACILLGAIGSQLSLLINPLKD